MGLGRPSTNLCAKQPHLAIRGDGQMHRHRFRLLSSAVLALGVPAILSACGGPGAAASTATTSTAPSIVISGAPSSGSSSSATVATSVATLSTASAQSGSATIAAVTTSSGAVTTTAATPLPAGGGQTYVVTGTGTESLRLRKTPDGAIVSRLADGTVLTAVGDAPQQAGSYTWIHVKTTKGVEGWVASAYLVAATPSPPKGGE
jgi:hypothetical protein